MSARDEAVEVVAHAMAAPVRDDPYNWVNPARVAIAALEAAGLLATEDEWGVKHKQGIRSESSQPSASEWAASAPRTLGGVVVTRRVTSWTEVQP